MTRYSDEIDIQVLLSGDQRGGLGPRKHAARPRGHIHKHPVAHRKPVKHRKPARPHHRHHVKRQRASYRSKGRNEAETQLVNASRARYDYSSGLFYFCIFLFVAAFIGLLVWLLLPKDSVTGIPITFRPSTSTATATNASTRIGSSAAPTGLDAGMVAGIVIAILAVFGIILAFAFWNRREATVKGGTDMDDEGTIDDEKSTGRSRSGTIEEFEEESMSGTSFGARGSEVSIKTEKSKIDRKKGSAIILPLPGARRPSVSSMIKESKKGIWKKLQAAETSTGNEIDAEMKAALKTIGEAEMKMQQSDLMNKLPAEALAERNKTLLDLRENSKWIDVKDATRVLGLTKSDHSPASVVGRNGSVNYILNDAEGNDYVVKNGYASHLPRL